MVAPLLSGFALFLFTLLLICSTAPARPVEEGFQNNMTVLLEEDYENVAQVWEMFNSYYEAYDNQDPVECLT